MADKPEEKRKVRRGKGSMLRGYGRMFVSPIRLGIYRAIFGVIGLILTVAFLYFLLSGAINQRETGETAISWFLNIGHKVGDFIVDLKENQAPIRIGPDGIYFRDAKPPSESSIDAPADKTGEGELNEFKNRVSENVSDEEQETNSEKTAQTD